MEISVRISALCYPVWHTVSSFGTYFQAVKSDLPEVEENFPSQIFRSHTRLPPGVRPKNLAWKIFFHLWQIRFYHLEIPLYSPLPPAMQQVCRFQVAAALLSSSSSLRARLQTPTPHSTKVPPPPPPHHPVGTITEPVAKVINGTGWGRDEVHVVELGGCSWKSRPQTRREPGLWPRLPALQPPRSTTCTSSRRQPVPFIALCTGSVITPS